MHSLEKKAHGIYKKSGSLLYFFDKKIAISQTWLDRKEPTGMYVGWLVELIGLN